MNNRSSHPSWPRLVALLPVLAAATAMALSSCASLSGNISGNFACRAAEGSCAPTATIDDRALALITGSDNRIGGVRTAGRTPPGLPDPGVGVAVTARGPGRVLRIVFPAHVDDQGRIHEINAVRAAVEGEPWPASPVALVATLQEAPTTAGVVAPGEPVVFDQAAERLADTVMTSGHDLPSQIAVAAARNRGADPVALIRSEVDRRLTEKGQRRSTSRVDANPKPVARSSPLLPRDQVTRDRLPTRVPPAVKERSGSEAALSSETLLKQNAVAAVVPAIPTHAGEP